MPTITDQAIVTRRWDFSETSQTVSLFTREHGVIRGLAKGAKREKGAFSGGMDLLTRGELIAILKPGRDLATLTAWHLQEIYRALRQDLHANRAGLYMADLIHHMLIEHDPHPAMFDAFAAALEGLNEPAAAETALLRMQWSLLTETGYAPHLDRDARTGQLLPENAATLAFSAAAGGVIIDREDAAPALDRWRVRRETVDVLRALASGELPSSAGAGPLRRANRLLAAYFRELIGSEPPTMRWAFPDLAGKP